MLNSPYRPVRALGNLAFALLMLLSVRRLKWFYSRGAVPGTRIECRDPRPVTGADVELCARLIAAHGKAVAGSGGGGGTEGMWSWIFDARQGELAAALEAGDPRELATLLASMFAGDFVLGMASGPLIRQTATGLGGRAWGLKCLDGLASLGEVVGAVAVENPEQGGAGLAFGGGLEEFFAALEAKLGFRVDFPDIGAPAGLLAAGRLVPPDMPDQIYGALRLGEAIALHLGESGGGRIVEIGGGYGGMAYWYAVGSAEFESYTIVDLPIVNVLQGYFLGQALGAERVALYGEDGSGDLKLVPNTALAEVGTPVDVMANKDSMPEMPTDAMVSYLEWGAANCTGIFYSYNQETASDFLDEAQGVVHREIAARGGFERLRRDRAWVRDGYVEEIYVPRAAAPPPV
jgi:hypothetical protein